MIHLNFKRPFLSINIFPDTKLPKFAIVTGLNGAGKTHLLKAIKSGAITVEPKLDEKSEIEYFDWINLVPKNVKEFDNSSITQNKRSLFRTFKGAIAGLRLPALTTIKKLNFPPNYYADPMQCLRLSDAKLVEIFGENQETKNIINHLKKIRDEYSQQLIDHISHQAHKKGIIQLALSLNKHIIELTESDFVSDSNVKWGTSTIFQQSFAELFVVYRDLKRKNMLKQLRKHKGEENVNALTDEEFYKLYLRPPWDFVNDALRSADLPFEIDHPDELEEGPYRPRLTKLSGGIEVPFDSLSSGEKIIMALALCLYYANDSRQLSSYPKLLLLDEIDAPLHPAMTKSLINTIQEILVKKYSISVILTTHSPSTVALAPEESIHVMKPECPGLHKVAKGVALNVLTYGVPTVSILYEGRRQILVESSIDARLYGGIYQLLVSTLESERSLEFVATGTRPLAGGGDINAGCENVVRLVNDLTAMGNATIFGLIDWDGHRKRTGRVLVLAEGRRDGLENVVLDPLLVACALVRVGGRARQCLDLPESISYRSILEFGSDKLQSLVDSVEEHVLSDCRGEKTTAKYNGGFALSLDERYITMDDHGLEKAVLDCFPSLKAISRERQGSLMCYVIENIMHDQPKFIPSEFVDVFNELLKMPAHREC